MGALPNAILHGFYRSESDGTARKHMGQSVYFTRRSPSKGLVRVFAHSLPTNCRYSVDVLWSHDGVSWNTITGLQNITTEDESSTEVALSMGRYFKLLLSVDDSTASAMLEAELSGWLSFRP